MKKCEHIYGYNDGWGHEDNGYLVDIKSKHIDHPFSFCPKCGKRLVREKKSDKRTK